MSEPCVAHHFVLESPNGPTVEGRCKLCGAVRTFATTQDAETIWKTEKGRFGGNRRAQNARREAGK